MTTAALPKKTKRGGARQGAGRKAEGSLICVRITDAQRATAKRLGGGSISAGVRAALISAATPPPAPDVEPGNPPPPAPAQR